MATSSDLAQSRLSDNELERKLSQIRELPVGVQQLIRKYAWDGLHDREWCREHGIDYVTADRQDFRRAMVIVYEEDYKAF